MMKVQIELPGWISDAFFLDDASDCWQMLSLLMV